MLKVYAPASIANINVGFDIIGIALSSVCKNTFNIGDIITIISSDKFIIENIGCFSEFIPKNYKDNIVYKCWNLFCKKIKKEILVKIILEKNLPVSSGLGSSASSIVSTLVALNIYCHYPLNQSEMLILMGEAEKNISQEIHYDNVAPSYLGGMQLISESNINISQSLPYFKNWLWVVAYPGSEINTSISREILPKLYKKEICILQSKYLANFIHAIYTKQDDLALNTMKDFIAEPYRISLIPELINIRKELMNLGSSVCGISGSGPTIFSVCNNFIIAELVSDWLIKNYLKNSKGFVRICNIDPLGARII